METIFSVSLQASGLWATAHAALRATARGGLLTVCLVATLLGGACAKGSSGNDPATVVQAFITATRNGDRAGAYRYLGPETRARLTQALQSAKRVSGRLELKPHDFLSVGQAPPAWEPSSVRAIDVNPRRAIVSVQSTTGDRHDLELISEDGAWKIELPMR